MKHCYKDHCNNASFNNQNSGKDITSKKDRFLFDVGQSVVTTMRR